MGKWDWILTESLTGNALKADRRHAVIQSVEEVTKK